MKPWHHGLPETKQFVVFPPIGQERAFNAARERIEVHLRRAFPEMQFEFEEFGLDEDASVIPMCGKVGDENSQILAPPSDIKLREIEAALRDFDCGRTGCLEVRPGAGSSARFKRSISPLRG